MEIVVKGLNELVHLDNKDFITEGGEGKIYAKDGFVYKIYLNPKNMIPFSKIEELSAIKNNNVIRPKEIVLDKKNRAIGYRMDHIKNTYSLCQLFPKIFRDREGLDNDKVVGLVQRMQDTVADIHKRNILVVDFNEVNFLVDKKFKEVYFIDVDSYQTPSFPATAISPTIRDWTTETFSVLTDWFSFGVIAFQMFIGIHPFRGRYEPIRYPKDKIREMQERMLAKIPVFHNEVSFPSVCLPFDVIPDAYKSWFKAIFYDGKRVAPPMGPVEIIIIPVVTKEVATDDAFKIDLLYTYPDEVIRFFSKDGIRISITKKEIYKEQELYGKPIDQKTPYIGITPRWNKIVAAILDDDHVHLHNLTDCCPIDFEMRAEELMSYDGRIYYKNEDRIYEISFLETGDMVIPSAKIVASVMNNSTQLFNGVVIQNILGEYVISLFPKENNHKQIKCEELQKYKIVDAKYENRVLFVIGSKKGKYTKFIFKFDDKLSSYTIRMIEDVPYVGINFCVLDNGIVAHINEDEQLEIFSNKKDSISLKEIDSKAITGDMKLFQDGNRVLFSQGKKVYSIKMR